VTVQLIVQVGVRLGTTPTQAALVEKKIFLFFLEKVAVVQGSSGAG
jgi:hypothetical protein